MLCLDAMIVTIKGPADKISWIACTRKLSESRLSGDFLVQAYHVTNGDMTFYQRNRDMKTNRMGIMEWMQQ